MAYDRWGHDEVYAGRLRPWSSPPGVRAILWIICLLVALLGGPSNDLPAAHTALGAGAGAAIASAAPSAAIVPSAGPPQSVITLSGSGFTPGDQLIVAYADIQNQLQTLAATTVAENGSINAPNLVIPTGAAVGGIGLVVVREAGDGGRRLTTMPFAVTPLASTLVATSNVVAPGDTIALRGGGFEPGSAVQLQLLSAGGSMALQGTVPITASAIGAIGPITVTIPATVTVASPTWAAVNATDAAGTVGGIALALVPAPAANAGLHLQPARAVLGAQVRVGAYGFIPGEGVSVTLIGASGLGAAVQAYQTIAAGPVNGVGTALGATLVADSSGYVEGIFAVPLGGDIVLGSAPGTPGGDGGTMLMVLLRGLQSGLTRTAPLILSATHLQPVPSITTPGHPYTILGSGFASGEQVRVVIADNTGASAVVGTFTAINCGDPAAILDDGSAIASSCVTGSFTAIATAPRPAQTTLSPPQVGSAAGPQSYSLSATGSISGLAASSALTLTGTPTLTLQPYVVAPGEGMVIQGDAFMPNATVSIRAAFPSGTTNGAATCAIGGGTASGNEAASPCAITMIVATDSDGSFKAQITVPLAAQTGPVAIQALDSRGDQASAVLSVNNQRPMLRLPSLSAQPGQVVTIHGGGFSSGETVDVSLAVPSSAGTVPSAASCGALRPQVLPASTLTTTADALGSFIVSYPLPQPFSQGTYYVAAIGETSGLCAFSPLSIADQAATPLPTVTACAPGQCLPLSTPTATPTPTPLCDEGSAAAPMGGCAQDTLIYFAAGSTAQISTSVRAGSSYPGTPCTGAASAATAHGTGNATTKCVPAVIAFGEELHLLNESDQAVSVDVEYFIYGLSSSQLRAAQSGAVADPDAWFTPSNGGNLQLQRGRTIILQPHAAIARSVNADIGDGHLVSIIVRAAGAVNATTVTHRDLLVEGCAPSGALHACKTPCTAARPCVYTLDAAGSPGSGAAGPQTIWLFAQGYVGSAVDEYVSLLNPQTDPTIVQLRMLTTHGAFPEVLRLSVPASGRQSVDLRSAVQTLCAQERRQHRPAPACALHDQAIGLQISSTQPIVAERALYWGDGSGPTRAGYDEGAGAPGIVTRSGVPVARTQYLPYASTLHGDQAVLALLDPTIHPATVTVSAFSASGIVLAAKTLVVPARGYATLSLTSMVFPGIYALMVQSAAAVTGELAQYSGGSPQSGAHVGFMEPLATAQTTGGVALLSAGSQAHGATDDLVVRIFNPGVRPIVARLGANTATGEDTLAQFQIATHATLQSTVPARRGGAAPTAGVSIACSGPCVGLALATMQGTRAGAAPEAIWSGALQ